MTEAHYEYSPFGEIVVQSGDLADSFTHRFSTKPWCAVTGLSEYEKRKYGAGLERWRSRDPIGEQGGKHLYAIGNNEIINQLDYFGLWSLSFKGEWDASEIKKVQVAFTTLRSLIPTYMAGWKSWVSAASQLPDDCEYKNAVQQELTKIYAILSGIRDGLNSSDTINVYKRDYKDAKDASVGMPFDNKPWNFGNTFNGKLYLNSGGSYPFNDWSPSYMLVKVFHELSHVANVLEERGTDGMWSDYAHNVETIAQDTTALKLSPMVCWNMLPFGKIICCPPRKEWMPAGE